MRVILLENIINLGKIGDNVTVKNGYGRNFLLKQGKALRYSKENENQTSEVLDNLLKNNRKPPTPRLSWSYASSLADGERHSIIAASCLDLGDFLLAVCHLKKAHVALNESLRLNRLFTHHSSKLLIEYLNETTIRMHDLREIWLRIMQDCRK